jgi:hypothetical protein
MPSPFPGMDPYLEQPAIWSQVHFKLTSVIQDELNARLPTGLIARVDRYVWIHEPGADQRIRLKPDTYIAQLDDGKKASTNTITLEAPAKTILPAVRKEGSRFIKIIDPLNQSVITVVEILSPANKAVGDDREAYLAKRNEYFGAKINLVEIDLLRSGLRMPLGEPPPLKADYYVLVSRALEFPQVGVWPLGVRDILPTIPIPLRPEDKDIELPLKFCLDRVYDLGRHAAEVNYFEPSLPPLSEQDATWAHELLSHKLGSQQKTN